MSAFTTSQDALNRYRSAGQNWRNLRADFESKQQRFDSLIGSEEKPADYGEQLDNLREWHEVLIWQINCAARETIYAQRRVMDTCVNEALTAFMTAHGSELTNALAPYLNGYPGLEAAMRVLRVAVARQAKTSKPEVGASWQPLLDETGLTPDTTMQKDCSYSYTAAKHLRYRFRLNCLNAQQGAN